MGQLTGKSAPVTACAHPQDLAAAKGQSDDPPRSRCGRRHDRLIAFLSQRPTHSFKQSGQSRAPIRSSTSARPAPHIFWKAKFDGS
ncbi:hypothetical protein SAMN05444170_7140 [Bradyrhizobium erythrophlei]|jgi:hypothetical protein|uniref:Uncharacterized protein n=1 Tax=Bradyrhizobium erythrophlei TaxID=1437360 RepID=A0A1M7UWL9_9BRAD|nr:hypothetical protein SAMN05444170_7140 [Bradyrhizobium erythrophlei]